MVDFKDFSHEDFSHLDFSRGARGEVNFISVPEYSAAARHGDTKSCENNALKLFVRAGKT